MSTTDKPTWLLAERFRDVPAIEEAITNFAHDQTGDNATGIVLAVLEHQAATEAAKATGTAGELSDEEILKIQEKHIPKHGWSTNGLSFARDVLAAARQPAPVVAVKIWQERVPGLTTGDVTAMQIHDAKDAEIADLRSALAATAAPVVAVLSESDIHAIIDNLPETAFEPTIAIGEITALFDDDNGEDVEVLESIKAYAKIVAFSAILAATNRSQP